MPAGALRRYAWPQWAAAANQSSNPTELLTPSCRRQLVALGKIFRSINRILLTEIASELELKKRQDEWEEREQRDFHPYPHRSESQGYLPGDTDTLASAININIPLPGEDLAPLMKSLEDDVCLPIWKSAASSLLVRQGNSGDVKWHAVKQLALDLLELRQDALAIFRDITEELKSRSCESLCEGLAAKIRMLERFARIYNRQEQPSTMDHKPQYEPHYSLHPIPDWKKRKTFEAYPYVRKKGTVMLTMTMLIFTLIASLSLIPAWKKSSNALGSTTDVDFWLLVQNSVMQILGLFTAGYPLQSRFKNSSSRWAQMFTALGCGCTVSAVPMYLYLPTMWSAMMSFIGAVAQAYTTLQLALAEN